MTVIGSDVAVGSSAPWLVSLKLPFTIATFVAFVASGSVLAAVLGAASVPVRNGLFVSNAFPLRSSLEPEFAIELDSKGCSALAFFELLLPLSLVLSTACSFFFSDFVCNFDVAVINFLYAAVNSVLVVAVLKSVLASSKTDLRLLTLSSVLVA